MRRRGFTLVELVVVLAIVGLLVAATGPAFLRPESAPRAPLDVGAEAMRELAGAARGAALREGRAVAFAVSADGDAWLRRAGRADSSLGRVLPAGVRVVADAAARTVVAFDAMGRASAPVAMVLRDAAGREEVVTVDPWTGAATRRPTTAHASP